nr:MAG TPA: hypothetical protein [Caudoviricetes sp.]
MVLVIPVFLPNREPIARPIEMMNDKSAFRALTNGRITAIKIWPNAVFRMFSCSFSKRI